MLKSLILIHLVERHKNFTNRYTLMNTITKAMTDRNASEHVSIATVHIIHYFESFFF